MFEDPGWVIFLTQLLLSLSVKKKTNRLRKTLNEFDWII